MNNRFTFRADNTLFFTNFPQSDDPNCEELVGSLYQSGVWEKLSEFKYKFVLTCMIPDCESFTQTPDEVRFSNPNLMIIKYIDDDPDDEVNYYYTELIRVE